MENYSLMCEQTIAIVKKTGEFIREQANVFSMDMIETKGRNDFVSYVDKTSEQLLIGDLTPLIAEAGFIAEENTSDKRGDKYNWIIDPLDGTTNFIHGYPCYAISVGLAHRGEVVLGVIYDVQQDECFYAWKGSKAYLNGKEISVSKRTALSDALVATGFPYTDYSRMKAYLALFEYLMQHTHGLRRPGSAAIDLAYVACGRFDAFYEYGLKPWDLAAGTLIIQQAGGKVSDFKGGSDFLFGKELVVSNTSIHEEFLKIIQQFMLEK